MDERLGLCILRFSKRLPDQRPCQSARGLRARRGVRQNARQLISLLQNGQSIVVLLPVAILHANGDQEFYVISGVLLIVLSVDNLLGPFEQFIDADPLPRRDAIRKQEMIELVDVFRTVQLAVGKVALPAHGAGLNQSSGETGEHREQSQRG